jgi:phosphonate transport system substrate-binding protein
MNRRFAAVASGITLAALFANGPALAAKRTTKPTRTTKASVPVTTAASQAAAPVTTVVAVATTVAPKPKATLRIGAIPDQDPARLTRIYNSVATYLGAKLGVKAEYVPVTDYASAVNLFRTGDLDLVWFGGLTGVQARLQTPGASLLAQRDIDESFRSVFIVNSSVKLPAITSVKGLALLKGLRFTYGSNASTSGFLMPEYFLDQAGLNDEQDFAGAVGFSGSHDKTIDLVQSGSFEGGALNEQVWKNRKAAGTVDLTKVVEVFRSPGYHDYQWVAGPKTDERFGAGFTDKLKATILGIDTKDPEAAAILTLFGAGKFVPADAKDYGDIERIGRKLKLINN